MNNMDGITYELTNVQGGLYSDKVYEYEIDITQVQGEKPNEQEILEYCKTKVHRCSKSINDEREWYESFYYFGKISEGKYSYKVTVPYCD